MTEEAATSQRTEVIRTGVEACNRLDVDAIMANVHPDVEVHEPPEVPDSGVYRGVDGYRESLAKVIDLFEEMSVEIEELAERDERVFLGIRTVGRGAGSAVPFDSMRWDVYDFRDGRVVAVRIFLDRDAAMREWISSS